ncbi:unnamed protein product, partial [Meganyctiphanes norvegica]
EISSIGDTELHTRTGGEREFEISATYVSNSATVDILFYEDGDVPSDSTQCTTNTNPCTATPPDAVVFNILLVALDDDGVVVESSITEFEDYAINVNQLSSKSVEVTWSGSTSPIKQELSNVSAATEYDYEVTIDDESAAFEKTVVNICDNDACKAFFVKITTSTIKCSVYKTSSPTMKTSRSLDMDTSAEPLILTRFSDLSKTANPIHVGFSSHGKVTGITELFLVVIKHDDPDPSEQSWVDTESLDDIPNNDEEVIFSFPYADRLPKVGDGDDVTLVVVAHDGEKPLAAGEFNFVFDA